MTNAPDKRYATEPAVSLFEADAPTARPKQRPSALTIGALLSVLRAIDGVSVIVGLITGWPQLQNELELEGVEPATVLKVIVGLQVAWIVLLLIVSWLMWRGSNAARLLVMSLTCVSITASAISYFASGAEITVHTTLLTLALDILMLLALSDRDVRAWTRARKPLP